MGIFVVAVLLRLVGATFNLEANDPHVDVAQIMAYEHRLPEYGEAWEAAQPKLYYATVAATLLLLPRDRGSLHTMAAQMVNCLAGIATLWLVLSLLSELDLRQRTLELTFALVALNPKMVATSIQATNDAFVILFGTLALAGGYRYLLRQQWRHWLQATAGLALACASKGNGLPIAAIVGVVWLAALLPQAAPRRRLLAGGAATVLAALLFVPVAGGYWASYQRTGQPFETQMTKAFPLHFSDQTLSRRPGITSVVDGFLTFRFIDLLRNPLNSNAAMEYSANRTSMWSFAYASAHTQHYDNFPVSWQWQSDSAAVRGLLRAIFCLALIPTALLAWGIARAAGRSLRQLLRWRLDGNWAAECLPGGATVGMIAFLIMYSYQFRDFGCMKPIFIYPAIAALAVCFARALDSLRAGGWAQRLGIMTGVALCAAYVAESAILDIGLALQRLRLV